MAIAVNDCISQRVLFYYLRNIERIVNMITGWGYEF